MVLVHYKKQQPCNTVRVEPGQMALTHSARDNRSIFRYIVSSLGTHVRNPSEEPRYAHKKSQFIGEVNYYYNFCGKIFKKMHRRVYELFLVLRKKDLCIGKHYIGADNVVPNFPFFWGGGKMYWLFNLKWKSLFFYPLAFCRGGGVKHNGCFS